MVMWLASNERLESHSKIGNHIKYLRGQLVSQSDHILYRL